MERPSISWNSLVRYCSLTILISFGLLSTPASRRLLRNIATGTSGSMKNIAKGKFLALEFRFPDPDEQTAIAAALAEMDAELSALEQRLAKTRALKLGMMQELLTGRTRLISKEAAYA